MLLETITFLPIFSLTCLVCLWSDFDIVSYSLLSYKYMHDTYIDTLVCICSCMSVILSVFILGRFVDFSQTWDYTICWWHFQYLCPVWVLDVCLDTAFNCDNSCQFVRTSTTYYDLGDLYGMWWLLVKGQSWGFTSRSTVRVILWQVLRIATGGTPTHRGDGLWLDAKLANH